MEIMFEFRQSDADAFFVQDMLYSFFTIVGLVYNSCYLKVIIGFHMESLLCNNRSELCLFISGTPQMGYSAMLKTIVRISSV